MKNIKTALLSAAITCGLSLGSVSVVAEPSQPGSDVKSGLQNTRLHHIADASRHKQESRKVAQNYIAKHDVPNNRLHHVGDASAHKEAIN